MKMIGLARLGRDAELRYLPDGTAVANLSLSYICGQKKQGDQYPPSQWIDASLWGKQAEALAQYLVKSSVHCFCLSDVRLEEYEGRNGKGVKMVARVDNVELGPRVGGNDQGSAPAPAQRPAAAPAARPAPRPAPNFSDMDDDIPF
ncbi:single-stranded DNA-binding protein [Bradyrhizobium sp. BWC-3-1]|uniref:single-stranded DNA-binding protein n=1 Tax=Bradyrhizobium sp. BWC-3-1 TaxID=3080012 RepID=UPI00293E5CCD|nr:single-stranded DNA-binding protein [Bradyrhizobium sp. BWC-3-1]WOH61956.1 single-stranded DNA-binding protein [Bradyrhizobium sp. BWC-3-1]